MAKTVYSDPSNTRRVTFQQLLEKYVELLETGTLTFDTPEEQSLFDALVQSAWALTKRPGTMNEVAKQEGGRLKRKTRKHKRKAH